MPRKLDTVTARVEGCPRCRKNHRAVQFTEMRYAVPVAGHGWGYYPYFGRCPNTLAPILGRNDMLTYELKHFL